MNNEMEQTNTIPGDENYIFQYFYELRTNIESSMRNIVEKLLKLKGFFCNYY